MPTLRCFPLACMGTRVAPFRMPWPCTGPIGPNTSLHSVAGWNADGGFDQTLLVRHARRTADGSGLIASGIPWARTATDQSPFQVAGTGPAGTEQCRWPPGVIRHGSSGGRRCEPPGLVLAMPVEAVFLPVLVHGVAKQLLQYLKVHLPSENDSGSNLFGCSRGSG